MSVKLGKRASEPYIYTGESFAHVKLVFKPLSGGNTECRWRRGTRTNHGDLQQEEIEVKRRKQQSKPRKSI